MKISRDHDADAATLRFNDGVSSYQAVRTVVCDIELSNCAVVLDFNEQDRLVAIELLGVSRLLPEGAELG